MELPKRESFTNPKDITDIHYWLKRWDGSIRSLKEISHIPHHHLTKQTEAKKNYSGSDPKNLSLFECTFNQK